MIKKVVLAVLCSGLFLSLQAAPTAKSTKAAPPATPPAKGARVATDPIPLFGVIKLTTGDRPTTFLDVVARPVSLSDLRLKNLGILLARTFKRPDLVPAKKEIKTRPGEPQPPVIGIYELVGRSPFNNGGGWQDLSTWVIQGSDNFLKSAPIDAGDIAAWTWSSPQADDKKWELVSGDQVMKLIPRAMDFTPTEFQSFAFSNAGIVKTRRYDNISSYMPHSVDGVIALASDGAMHVEGLFKFALWPTVYHLSGIRYEDEIFLECSNARSTAADYRFHSNASRYRNGIVGFCKDPTTFRIKITKNLVQIANQSSGAKFDWAKDFTTQASICTEIQRSALIPLPELSESCRTQFGSAIWMVSDGSPSFYQEADAAWVAQKRPLSLPSFYLDAMFPNVYPDKDVLRSGLERRIKELGVPVVSLPIPPR